MAEFIWGILSNKADLSQKNIIKLIAALQTNTEAISRLEFRLKHIDGEIEEIPKLKNEIVKVFSALRHLAGDRWDEIKEAVKGDQDFLS